MRAQDDTTLAKSEAVLDLVGARPWVPHGALVDCLASPDTAARARLVDAQMLWRGVVGVKTCDIPDVETGELCDRPLHRSRTAIWPFCFEHGDEWRDYSTRSEEMRQKPLEPADWAEWRKTGEIKQGGLRLG